MKRATVRLGFFLLACLSVSACDEKKAETKAEPPATAAAKALPSPVPAPSEVAPVEPEAPKKKEPKVCKAGTVVDFSGNDALETNVRLKLSKPKGDITVAELAKVRSVNLSQTKVDELDPCIFPHFKNLKELFLGAGKLDDLSPISGLTGLEALRASLNRVSDAKPLANLTKMDRLDLGHTQVADLAPLAGMTELTELELDDTPVKDLAPLANCKKLERLSIQRTNVKDVSPLKGLEKLKFLYVTGAPIDDTSALGPLRARGLKIIDQ
jgi:internalin A